MNANLALTQLLPLAEELDKDKVTPGVLGFLVFAALAIGVWFLMKSMNRHMGRVDFEEEPEDGSPATAKKAPASAGGPAAGTGRGADGDT
ncbi:hypothetical protein [Streptomyces sp. YIM 130001]|uniref:hypothetical protein n=1 Tax=Streptomyces sp. YIM 130001 TaxID=2259644 RepID=UPI000E64E0E9|nr:hypothetical protein [Streptomyces sp. YIM 130001]